MKSLIIEIETYSDGELRITLPTDIINTDEEGEEEALPNPAQWLAMLGEDAESSPQEEES